ncbi:MAG: DNA recombination protein RmuC [Parvularculaceae bacterium]|nr:DNA recombination protein RmuC [Parvularculaceae bacterium]
MPPIFQEPLFWALAASGTLLCLLAVAALRLAQVQERARAGARAERDLAQTRLTAEELARAKGEAEARHAAAQARADALTQSLDRLASEAGALRAERDGLDRDLARLRAEAAGFERQIADLKQAKEDMKNAFAVSADTLMKSHSESFKSQNKDQIDALLTPLKKDIDDFKRSLGDAHVETSKQHGSLKQQIEQLALQSASVSKEAENLTRALKGDVQMQGAWGEMIVDTILSRLGLREGVEYSRQESFTGEDGRARTDYIVNLPTGERLIIDSKVSLVDFEAFVNETGEDARAQRLGAHARSLRTHMKGLASKEYQARVGTRLDFVIMFVPIEAALGAALKADETLTLDALDNKVAIATPTTLTTQLKTVAAMWRIERQHQNAEDIAARAGALYDKFAGFAADMQTIGTRLSQLDGAYQEAMKKLSTGSGNLVRQTELLKALGAATGKSVPKPLLEAAGASDHQVLLQIEARLPADGADKPGDLVQ